MYSVHPIFTFLHMSLLVKTRKLSYRKDDRAMRPIYGRPETFRVAEYTHGYFS